jgi:hypothetical protein
MGGMGNRRSDRITITLSVEATGIDAENRPFIDTATTIVLNRDGALLSLKHPLQLGQTISLQRRLADGTKREAKARVIVKESVTADGAAYGVSFVDAKTDFWGIEFPSRAQAAGAMVRLLVECTHCHSQELAYLGRRELKEFETHRMFARQCRMCEAPTIWKQPAEEGVRAGHKDAQSDGETLGKPSLREEPRYDTRLTACVRQGKDEEMAVCENVSQQGIAFRSKRKFAEGTMIEVAVPYTAGTPNVFIPAMVVHSRPLPTAGLHRHGVKYLHKDKD